MDPVRTCLGCGRKGRKAELVRLVVQEGTMMADLRQSRPGRGAYCCPNATCLQRLGRQRKRLAWALRWPGPAALVLAPELTALFDR